MRKMFIFCTLFGCVSATTAQDVKQRLEKSPRHHEWVDVKNGDRKVACFVVYPEVKDKAAALVVIHENKGLTDFARGVADQLAEAGYIAIAPDCLSGMGPKGGNTDSFASMGDATKAIGKLTQLPNQVTGDLNAAADYVLTLKACNGKLAVCGFCWGGGQAFRFATNRKDLKAAFVFYGMTALTKDTVDKIPCPIYGFYGGNDARINESIPRTQELMKASGKKYEPVTYDGAGHGFMRTGEEPGANAANRDGRSAAWERWKVILKKL